jgi:hypothetical protein
MIPEYMRRISLSTFLLSSVAAWSLTVALHASPIVYVSNTSQLGTVDLSTGAFHQIGPDFTDASQGLGFGPNGLLLTMGFDGYLNSINPGTGVMTRIGPSGLSDCSTPTSPCAGNSVSVLASFNGQTLVTDFENRLYDVNASTGVATSIGLTGMPAIPFIPLSENPDGTLNIYDEALFEANGKLYATFDAGHLDLSNGEIAPVVNPMLYQINVATGKATSIGPTVFGLGAAIETGGITYAFLDATSQLATLDLATGQTTAIGEFDGAAGVVSAAVATPEPAGAAILAIGIVGLVAWRLRKSRC